MTDRIIQLSRQLGALQGAAEWARDALNGTNACFFADQEEAIKSALYSLQIALDHDGSEDYLDRRENVS